jgi:hypothetical protein
LGLERGPLSLVSTTEELLGRKNSGSGLESRDYGRRDSSRKPRDILCPQKVGTNFADGRRSSGRYSSFADSGHGVCYLTSPCRYPKLKVFLNFRTLVFSFLKLVQTLEIIV